MVIPVLISAAIGAVISVVIQAFISVCMFVASDVIVHVFISLIIVYASRTPPRSNRQKPLMRCSIANVVVIILVINAAKYVVVPAFICVIMIAVNSVVIPVSFLYVLVQLFLLLFLCLFLYVCLLLAL